MRRPTSTCGVHGAPGRVRGPDGVPGAAPRIDGPGPLSSPGGRPPPSTRRSSRWPTLWPPTPGPATTSDGRCRSRARPPWWAPPTPTATRGPPTSSPRWTAPGQQPSSGLGRQNERRVRLVGGHLGVHRGHRGPRHYGLGAAYVFTDAGGTWTQQPSCQPRRVGADDLKFGYSVVTSGSTVMVGADGYAARRRRLRLLRHRRYLDPRGPELSSAAAPPMTISAGRWPCRHRTLVVSAVRHATTPGPSTSSPTSGGTWTSSRADRRLTVRRRLLRRQGGHQRERRSWPVPRVTTTSRAPPTSSHGSGATWKQVAELKASDGGPNDCFGWAVGLSGKTILVGAEQTNNDSGAAYVFSPEGSDEVGPAVTS